METIKNALSVGDPNFPDKKIVTIVKKDGSIVSGKVIQEDPNGNPIVVDANFSFYRKLDGVWHPIGIVHFGKWSRFEVKEEY